MSDGRSDAELRELLRGTDARHTDRLAAFTRRYSGERSTQPKIARHLARLGLAESTAPVGDAFDLEGAESFAAILREHPVYEGEAPSLVGLPVFGDYDDGDVTGGRPRREAAEILTAGAISLGRVGVTEDRAVDALIQVALSADRLSRAFSLVLRGKPLPVPRDPPDMDRLLDLGREMLMRACGWGLASAVTEFKGAVAAEAAAARDIRRHPPIYSTYADAIESIEPSPGCAGDVVTIRGSGFGVGEPQDVGVYFPRLGGGCVRASVEPRGWGDTAIRVRVPDEVGCGCVGFVKLLSKAPPPGTAPGRLAAAAEALAGTLEMCLGGPGFAGAQAVRGAGQFQALAPPPPCPECLPDNRNYFHGGPPTGVSLTVNGATDLTVAPSETFLLAWTAENATSVRLRRVWGGGPALDMLNPPDSVVVGPFTENQAADAAYEVVAETSCGGVSRMVTVHLRQAPVLSVIRIEVVQALQRTNNSVRLVANKRTMARIFVDSGIRTGFDNGAGPNSQPEVAGEVTVREAGGAGFRWPATPLRADRGGSVTVARPGADIDRNWFSHSLNVELPTSHLSGAALIEARVFVKGHENETGGPYVAFGSTTALFHPRPRQEILPLLIRDGHLNLEPPSLVDFYAALSGARPRLPSAEDGFIVNPPLDIATSRDLTKQVGWLLLVADLTTMLLLFRPTPVGGVRAGLVRNDIRYGQNGIAVTRVGVTVPALVCRAGLPATLAHELGHAYGAGHSSCPAPGEDNAPGFPHDFVRIPPRTEEPGLNLDTDVWHATGNWELMSYCGGADRWPSIGAWDIVFDAWPA